MPFRIFCGALLLAFVAMESRGVNLIPQTTRVQIPRSVRALPGGYGGGGFWGGGFRGGK